MLDQKHECFKYVLPLNNWLDWIGTRQENKCHKPTKRAWKYTKVNIFFHCMTNFYNFALKIETSPAKRVVKPISETKKCQ